ncbi:MAG: redoxin domain-containing protein [Clostridia bacterium]|nr:redoxin domain-containing protein [Clostridia bacterium]
MKRIIAILLAAVMLAASPAALADPDFSHAGENVSGFSARLITGGDIDGSTFCDHPVSVVTYWATWSPQCRAQMTYLAQVHEEHPDYLVMGLLYVDGASTEEAALAFMNDNGFDFPVFVCDEVWSAIVGAFPYIPQSFIINPQGLILESRIAPFLSAGELEERLEFWRNVIPHSGDTDRNGVVNSSDALIVLRMALGILELGDNVLLCADYDRNGVIDTVDALMILRYSLQMN